MMLMPHAVANEVQGIGTLAHIVHQAHAVCTQLIHISNVLLPKHLLSNSTRCLDSDTCSLQTGIRNTTDLQNSVLRKTLSESAYNNSSQQFIKTML